MNCPAVDSVMDLYREDRLTPGRRAAVDAHLSWCKGHTRAAAPRPAAAAAPAALKDRLRAGKPEAAPSAPPRRRAHAGALAVSLALAVGALAVVHALAPNLPSQRPLGGWRLP